MSRNVKYLTGSHTLAIPLMAKPPPSIRKSSMKLPNHSHKIDKTNRMSDADCGIRKVNGAGEVELGREIGQMRGVETEDDGECAGTEADEEDDDDDGDADVLSPPAHTSNETGSQAGLLYGMTDLHSRNVCLKRRRQPESSDEETAKTRIKTAKATHELDDAKVKSDDEDYAGVDLISDCEERDRTLEQIEERIIIDSEEEDGAMLPSNLFSLVGWDSFDAMDDMFSLPNVPSFQEQTRRSDRISLTDEDAGFNQMLPFDEPSLPNPPPRRRVRFVDISESASEGSAIDAEDEDTTFPDLFLEQNHLDPSFRRAIERADDTRGADSSLFTGWDNMQGSFGLTHNVLEGQDSDSSYESTSSYETDPGETTEEDETLPQIIARPEQLLRRSSTSSVEPTISSTLTTVRTGSASRCYGPTMGSWIADPTKPIAVIDNTGKGMIIIPALRPHKVDRMFEQISSVSATANNSPRAPFAGLADAAEDSENDDSDAALIDSGFGVIVPQQIHNGPRSESFHPSRHILGPPEAFYPFMAVDADGTVHNEGIDEDEDDDDDGEAALNVNDFIDFGDDASDSDGYMESNAQALSSVSPSSPDQRAIIRASIFDGALGSTAQQILHIDKTQVSAFRRNQEHHRAGINRPVINASIKGGRHIAANSPLSPLRKRSTSNTSNSYRIGKSNSRSPVSGNVAKRRVLNNNVNHVHR